MSARPFAFSTEHRKKTGTLILHCAKQSDMDTFQWPSGVTNFILNGDQVNHLTVPEGVQTIYCSGQGLCTLRLPDSCVIVRAENNRLTELELPAGVELVSAENNLITELRFRGGQPRALAQINLEFNRLRRVDFVPPPTLEEIKLQGNGVLEYIAPEVLQVIKTHEDCTL